MLTTYALAVIIILGMLGGWITIQHLARLMAAHHPELGPAREEGGGCGLRCACSGGACTQSSTTPIPHDSNPHHSSTPPLQHANPPTLHHSTAKEPS